MLLEVAGLRKGASTTVGRDGGGAEPFGTRDPEVARLILERNMIEGYRTELAELKEVREGMDEM